MGKVELKPLKNPGDAPGHVNDELPEVSVPLSVTADATPGVIAAVSVSAAETSNVRIDPFLVIMVLAPSRDS